MKEARLRKTCLITGATRGIGLELALALAREGHDTILLGRDRARLAQAEEDVTRAGQAAGAQCHGLLGDLSDMGDVARIGEEVKRRFDRLDLLVNNAGAIFPQHETTADGYEKTFALNHLAYFGLTLRLVPLLAAGSAGRIINVASRAHEGVDLDFNDLMHTRRYRPWRAYQRSKLANILFTRELARRLRPHSLETFAAHPGLVATHFGHERHPGWSLLLWLARPWMLDVTAGAATPLHLALAPTLAAGSGSYWARSKPVSPSSAALNDETALRLWQASERLTGLVWEPPAPGTNL
ncbi:MAG: SDR family oxidoreductase [Candidatus Sericytochromatia bacterium]|nr:SDR family oxidoreductase [Candidatus Sericytochromatia bacterium]